MNIFLLLLSVQLLAIHVKNIECATGLIDTDPNGQCYNSCKSHYGFVVASSQIDCTNCCKSVNSKSTKGTCRKPKSPGPINCYCTVEGRVNVEIKEIPSCKTECKDMRYIKVHRDESCATCCKKFNYKTCVKAECKRGSFGFAKTETCTCTFHTPVNRSTYNNNRNIGIRGKSRGVARIGRSNSSFGRRQSY